MAPPGFPAVRKCPCRGTRCDRQPAQAASVVPAVRVVRVAPEVWAALAVPVGPVALEVWVASAVPVGRVALEVWVVSAVPVARVAPVVWAGSAVRVGRVAPDVSAVRLGLAVRAALVGQVVPEGQRSAPQPVRNNVPAARSVT